MSPTSRPDAPPLHQRPVTALKGVGKQLAPKLEKLGLRTVQDVLFHLPLRYEDRTRVVPMGSLRMGMHVAVEGEVQLQDIKIGRRRTWLVYLSDGTGSLTLRFFYFGKAQRSKVARGVRMRCFGEVRRGPQGPEMVHPEYDIIEGDGPAPTEDHLTPVYPTTEGVNQPGLRRLTNQALACLDDDALAEWLPTALRQGMPPLEEAIRLLHRPPPDIALSDLIDGNHPAQRRLAFEELLAHNLSLLRLRAQTRHHPAPVIDTPGLLAARLLASLPFRPTGAQERVTDEILTDLRRAEPMLRLVQGDVGSGKTLVAALAALHAVEAGHQVAIMAPTEILAEQHFVNLSDWLLPLDCPVAWLSGRQKAAARRESIALVASGQARVVVGTHALFQAEVEFRDLGLVVIDEQHRFGVHQRLALREKGALGDRRPHQLIMTATPIPRTLAMTAYADLDVSVIDELPPGRKPVKTVVVSGQRREEIAARIEHIRAQGRQAYWVCTLIEESEALQAQAAEDTAKLLAELLPELNVALVHGRMKPAEKEAVMGAFKDGDIHLLVATTVIEVGVDVPNASLMIIENAERLGLAQLHQLRGRVGRGSAESTCVLMYHPPLGDTARTRLDLMRRENSGFVIAQKDLEIRGPGEVLGTKQTGLVDFHIADLQRDEDLLDPVRAAADIISERHPEAVQALIDRWLGDRSVYGQV
ncbi:MAG: ATP-dependent DNA helicase RecG [Gammaproteobacteria bacterium]